MGKWFAPYVTEVLSSIKEGVERGAVRIVLLSVKSNYGGGEAADLEVPALMKEVRKAYVNKRVPFYFDGAYQVQWENILVQQTSKHYLKDDLQMWATREKHYLTVVACDEMLMPGTRNLLNDFNQKHPEKRVGMCWTEVNESDRPIKRKN